MNNQSKTKRISDIPNQVSLLFSIYGLLFNIFWSCSALAVYWIEVRKYSRTLLNHSYGP